MANYFRPRRRRRCAPRWRQLFYEPFESRLLLSSAPAGTDKSLTILEDTPYAFAAADFGFTDPLDTPANGFLGVKIAALPAKGALTVDGVVVSSGQFVPRTNIPGLKFIPAANENGIACAALAFQVQDDGGTASGGNDLDPTPNTLTVNVTPVNDPPSGSPPYPYASVTDKSTYTLTVADFGFSDPFDTPPNAFMALKVSTLPTAGWLDLNGNPVVAGQVIAASDIALGKLVYRPDPLKHFVVVGNIVHYPSFTYQLQDDGGIANGGKDLTPNPTELSIVVIGVNNPPSGTSSVRTVVENRDYYVSITDFGFTDPKEFPLSDLPPNSMTGVYITTLPAAGTLTLAGAPVTPGQFLFVSDINSRVVFAAPSQAAALTTSFTFQVRDNGGTANGGIDTDPVPKTLTLYIARADQQISGQNHTVTGLEDTPYTFSAADFPFTDTYDAPYSGLNQILLWGIPSPSSGKLTYYGTTVNLIVPNTNIVTAQGLAEGALVYVPAANQSGPSVASFPYYIKDVGNNLTPTLSTQTINLTGVNDPPQGNDLVKTTLEDTLLAFSAADFTFYDGADSPQNQLAAVKITTLPEQGTLRLGTTAVTAGQLIAAGQLATLNYTPPPNANGFAFSRFTFQVQDDGGTANGGQDTDPTPNTITMNVNWVNDAPSGTDGAVTTREDTDYTFSRSDFGFIDINDIQPLENLFLAVRVATPPTSGTLTANGSPVTAGALIPVDVIAAGALRFVPAANANGSPYAGFTFQVQDDFGIANGGQDTDPTPNTLTINVSAVNDPPHGENRTVNLYCGPRTLTIADFGYSDPDDNPPNDPLAVSLTLTGGLTLTNGGVVIPVNEVAHVVSYSDIAAGKLVYTPPPVGGLVATLQFQVQDSGGTANGGRDRLDPVTNLISFVVSLAPPQPPPAGIDNMLTILEDQTYRFQRADFPYTVFGIDNLKAVQIATLPVSGQLLDNGVPVEAGQFVPVFDIMMRRLSFTPAANASGVGAASFTFRVQDDGGTACGGLRLDIDQTPNTLTFNIMSVNDPPSGQDRTVALTCGYTYTFTVADFPFSDAADVPANSLAGIRVVTLPFTGSLTNRGVAVAYGQLIPVADIASGSFAYQFASSLFSPWSFNFRVQDNGGTASGGVDLAPNVNLFSLYLTGKPPLPPDSADATMTTLEDQAYIFRQADFPLSGNAGNSLVAVRLTTLPTTGGLKLNGEPVVAGQFISAADLAAGKLTYVPPANFAGNGLVSFMFQVQDNSSICGGEDLDPTPNTLTINVTPVNDPPVLIIKSPQVTATDEDGPRLILGWAEVSVGPPNEVGQTLTYLMQNNSNPSLFSVPPSVDAVGNLSFTPRPNAHGTAQITISLKDNGGTASGGNDTSDPQIFSIEITKPHPWHNTINPLDVDGDQFVSPSDALWVINVLNAFGPGLLPGDRAAFPSLFGSLYVDTVNGSGALLGDNFLTAGDALAVINYINAFGAGPVNPPSGESAPEATSPTTDDWLSLLAGDIAAQPRKRP